MKHKRVSNKQMRQMMSDLGIGDDHQDEEQLLLLTVTSINCMV